MRALLLISIAACAPPLREGGPRGLRADQHLDLASQHAEMASELERWPEWPRMEPGSIEPLAIIPDIVPMPVQEHDKRVRTHRAGAAEILADYEAACGQRPASEVTVSPLERFLAGGYNTERGVVVVLDAEAGEPAEVLSLMHCHRAWLMFDTRESDDPLDVPGLFLEARSANGGVAVALTPQDPAWISELQRRVARQLEGVPQ